MKKTIVILHGWAYSTDKWQPLLDILKKDFTVLLLKIPALTAPVEKAWTLHDYDLWLEKQFASLKKPLILLGHSNGGRLALSYLSKHPEKATHLVLIDSAGIYHNDFYIQIKRLVFKKMASLKRIIHKPFLEKLLYKVVREKDYVKAPPLTRETMRNLISTDITPVLPKVLTPTTIIWGGKDTITPLSDGNILHTTLPHSTLTVIKNARHSPQFTHVTEIAHIINSIKLS